MYAADTCMHVWEFGPNSRALAEEASACARARRARMGEAGLGVCCCCGQPLSPASPGLALAREGALFEVCRRCWLTAETERLLPLLCEEDLRQTPLAVAAEAALATLWGLLSQLEHSAADAPCLVPGPRPSLRPKARPRQRPSLARPGRPEPEEEPERWPRSPRLLPEE